MNIRKTISISFPLKDDSNGNLLKMNTTTLDDIRSSLYFFITTKKGERWYIPDFGTRLYEFLFEKNDSILEEDIINSLKSDIEKYFTNLTITDIQLIKSDDDKSLDIYVFYSLGEKFSNINDNIVLTIEL
jgi:phage baseplate assembly protein W